LIDKLNEARKLIAYLVGVLAEVLNTGLVPAPYSTYMHAVIVIGTAVAVYVIPNDQPAGKHAA
jgi:hypothetical protein